MFASKRDTWIVVLIWGGALMSAYAGFAQFSSAASFLTRLAVLIGLLCAAAFMLWVLYGTDYALGDGTLLIRCGPFRYRVPLGAIDSVSASRNPLSSPACSLDRLLIKWDEGRRRILISPFGKDDFLRDLARRCPHLRPQGHGLVRISAD